MSFWSVPERCRRKLLAVLHCNALESLLKSYAERLRSFPKFCFEIFSEDAAASFRKISPGDAPESFLKSHLATVITRSFRKAHVETRLQNVTENLLWIVLRYAAASFPRGVRKLAASPDGHIAETHRCKLSETSSLPGCYFAMLPKASREASESFLYRALDIFNEARNWKFSEISLRNCAEDCHWKLSKSFLKTHFDIARKNSTESFRKATECIALADTNSKLPFVATEDF